MKKLNQVLQSKIFFIIILFMSLLSVLLGKNKTTLDINSNYFDGVIENYKFNGDKLTLQVKGKERILANYYIKTYDEKIYLENNIVIGSKIKLNGSFSIPSSNSIPNTFNYKKYLKSKKIYLIMNTSNYKLSSKCNIFYKLKNVIIKLIEKRKRKDYFYMFILGNKDYLDINIYDSYKTNGITHLFAISGMHISMIILILKKNKIKDIFIIIVLYVYSFLVMFSPSVLRVTIFYNLKSLKCFKNISNVKLLIITASILILSNSNIIYDVGFLYSFIITLGLFLMKPKNIISLSVIAFLLSLPITLYNNFEFNALSIVINIIIVPFVSIILYPFLLLTMILPFLENILIFLINILEYINLLVSKYSIDIVVGKMNIIEILIYYLVLYYYFKNRNNKLLLVLLIVITISKYKFNLDGNYYTYYLDVGQGDCSIIVSPHKKEVLMIDTGGKVKYESDEAWKKKNNTYEDGKTIISFLKSIGVFKLNYLILSHGDYDHVGNAEYIVNNFKIEKVIFNNDDYNELETTLIYYLDKMKINYYKNLEDLNISNINLNFLNTKHYDNENDNSNVIYTKLNNYSLLFMGDASSVTEKEILKEFDLPNIDVLKVGHHGSKTSSSKEFIDAIKPKHSIISVGKNNRYGHPNKEVLDNLSNSKIYRTDQDGSIMLKIKNNKLKIETCCS